MAFSRPRWLHQQECVTVIMYYKGKEAIKDLFTKKGRTSKDISPKAELIQHTKGSLKFRHCWNRYLQQLNRDGRETSKTCWCHIGKFA